MKKNLLIGLLGGFASLLLCSGASATYIGLTLQLYSIVNIEGVQRCVYRVYANFSNPNDYATAVSGSDLVGNLRIESRAPSGIGLGTSFFNPLHNNLAPTFEQVYGGFDEEGNPVAPVPNAEWETFATIGVAVNDQAGLGDQTGLSAGFPNFIGSNMINSNNIAWFTPGPKEQGRAGHWALNRVLLMQLTVRTPETVRGTISVSGVNVGGSAFQVNGQTFDSFDIPRPPAPGGLSLLAAALLAPTRKRRAIG